MPTKDVESQFNILGQISMISPARTRITGTLTDQNHRKKYDTG